MTKPRPAPPTPTERSPHATRRASALWQVLSYERHQVVLPHEAYWWDNRRRGPADTVVFQYTLRGSLTLVRDGQRHRVPTGHAALFGYPEPSAYGIADDGERYECCWFALGGAGLTAHWRELIALGGPAPAFGRDHPVLAAYRYACDAALGDDPIALAEAVQRFVLACYRGVRQRRLEDLPPADGAVERILAMPHHPWSLKALAREHGCSREHLVRVFRDRVGHPPARWLRERRLERARDLLRETRLSISEVARQAGFGSTHTLARCVRDQEGCGPQALRDRLRE